MRANAIRRLWIGGNKYIESREFHNMRNPVFSRNWNVPLELPKMSADYVKGDNFVSYTLLEDLRKAYAAGVFHEMGDISENEDRYVSELERRMMALDEKSTYIAIKALVSQHFDTVVKSLAYLKKQEGEKQCHT